MEGDREQIRRRFAASVTKLLFSSEFREIFCESNGERNILVALPDDRMGDVFARLADYDSCATLVSPTPGGFSVAGFTPADVMAGQRADDDDCPIHEDSQVGMFVEYLRTVKRPVVCQLQKPACEVELLEDAGDPVGL